MIDVTTETYNSYIESGNNIMLYIYDDSPESQIQFSIMKSIDNFIGKDFDIIKIYAPNEPEIINILSIKKIPSIVRIDKKKIVAKLSGIRTENEIIKIMK